MSKEQSPLSRWPAVPIPVDYQSRVEPIRPVPILPETRHKAIAAHWAHVRRDLSLIRGKPNE
jgi:hypothetical protein